MCTELKKINKNKVNIKSHDIVYATNQSLNSENISRWNRNTQCDLTASKMYEILTNVKLQMMKE